MKFSIPFFSDDNARYEDDEDNDDQSYEPAAEAPDVDDFNDNGGVAGMKQSTNVNRRLFATLGFVESSSHVLRSAEEKRSIPTKSEVTKEYQKMVC